MESQGTAGAAQERELYQAGLYLDGSGAINYIRCGCCSFHMELDGGVKAADAILDHGLVSPGCGMGSEEAVSATREASIFRTADFDSASEYSSDSECGGLCLELDHMFPEYESFAIRMETFKNAPTSNADAADLAAAGFYSKSGGDGVGGEAGNDDDEADEGDILQCWSCSLQIASSELTGSNKLQDPFLVHQQRAPHCAFMTDLVSGRAFELLSDEGEALPDPHENDNAMSSERQRLLTFADVDPEKMPAAAAWSSNGFYFTGIEGIVRCALCRLTMAGAACQDESAIQREHRFRSPFCKLVSAPRGGGAPCRQQSDDDDDDDGGEEAETGLQCESARFSTFSAWPEHATPAGAGELAAAGFHYAGVGDSVTCFACNVTVRHFPTGRSAVEAHGAQVPQCPLLTGCGDATPGNVPLRVPAIGAPERLRDHDARLGTFRSWPTRIVPVGGEQLADAGLFYLNAGDIVCCAFCWVELRHWRHGQTAWGRHQDASPSCEYVRENCPRNIAAYINTFFTPNRGMPTSTEMEEIGLPQRSLSTKPFIPPSAPSTSQARRQEPQPEPIFPRPVAPWPRSMLPPPRNPVPASPVHTNRQPGGLVPGVRMPVMRARRAPQRQAPAPQPRPANVCIGCAGSVSHFLMPCSHLSCSQCAELLAFCPASGCEQPVASTVRILTF